MMESNNPELMSVDEYLHYTCLRVYEEVESNEISATLKTLADADKPLARNVRNHRGLAGSEFDVVALMHCIGGPFYRLDEYGHPIKLGWQGIKALDAIEKLGVSAVYVPRQFMEKLIASVSVTSTKEEQNAQEEGLFPPMRVAALITTFRLTAVQAEWLHNGCSNNRDWAKNARTARGMYNPEKIAEVLINKGYVAADNANRWLKATLPEDQREFL